MLSQQEVERDTMIPIFPSKAKINFGGDANCEPSKTIVGFRKAEDTVTTHSEEYRKKQISL